MRTLILSLALSSSLAVVAAEETKPQAGTPAPASKPADAAAPAAPSAAPAPGGTAPAPVSLLDAIENARKTQGNQATPPTPLNNGQAAPSPQGQNPDLASLLKAIEESKKKSAPAQ